MSERLRTWLVPASLVLTVALLFHRLLLGDVLYWGTISLQFYPWQEMAFSMLREGQLPLWNALSGSGSPLLANYQTAIFYPLNWFNLLIPTRYAIGIVTILSIVIGGLGMVAYLRRLDLDVTAQAVGALSFALNGFLVSKTMFPSIVNTVIWIPWLLWALDGLALNDLGSKAFHRALWTVPIFIAFLLLGGHAQTAFYALLLGAAYVLFRAVRHPDRWRFMVLALMGVLLGAGIAAVQLAPTAELLMLSQRSGGTDPQIALTYSYSPARFLTWLSPNLFGTPAADNYIGYGAYWEDATYGGVLTVLLAIRAISTWLRERQAGAAASYRVLVPFYLLVVLFATVFALGKNTPIFPFLYEYVPTFDMFRSPARWMILVVVGLSVLGAIGAEGWTTYRAGRHWANRGIVIGMALLIAVGAVQYMEIAVEPVLLSGTIRLAVAVAVACGLVLLRRYAERHRQWEPYMVLVVVTVLAVDLVTAHWGLIPTQAASFYDPVSDSFVDTVRGAAGQGRVIMPPADEQDIGFRDGDEEEAGTGEDDYLTFRGFLGHEAGRWESFRASYLPNLNMGYGVPSTSIFEPLQVGHHAELLMEADNLSPDQATSFYESMGTSVWLSANDDLPLDQIAVHGPVYAYSLPNPWPRVSLADCEPDGMGAWCSPLTEGEVSIIEDPPNGEIVIDVDVPGNAYLLLLDTDYPGWIAEIDGEPVRVLRANRAFRAIEVEAGQHRVQWHYRPVSLRIGGLISVLSVLSVLGGMAWAGRLHQ